LQAVAVAPDQEILELVQAVEVLVVIELLIVQQAVVVLPNHQLVQKKTLTTP
jgi:hypothetical protein